jgi:hypothetical protein
MTPRSCPACARPLADSNSRFCPECGAAQETEHAPTVASPVRSRSARGHETRFLPGTVLDRRYRIVAPLGRGGMGEVYRAEDLKLGQTVALKFLPRALEHDPERLALLLDEVKLARQVSHPNVCRVWDAGESDGQTYLAMEYVDGEDLGALLRRIGRLPEDRAVQVANEICAGLAAIHEQGVLHRDIKPSNVMLDGRGRVRITDFGLATPARFAAGADVRSGTPAYMAPEQLEGREVTIRSDVYALGLVLYELFTGRQAFASGREASKPGSSSRPETPSSHVRTLDPMIERAILRCLEPDPAARPPSAMSVARALPGGDPLEAARLAGETPSPEMVAAAGGAGGLHPLAAAGCVAFAVIGIVGVLVMAERRGLPFGPEDKPYVALRDRATEFVRGLGHAGRDDHVVDGVTRVGEGLWNATHADSPRVFYWYRRSPFAILPVIDEHDKNYDFDLPVPVDPGALALRLALDGRLLEFRRVPDRTPGGARDSIAWDSYFAAARLDPATAKPVTPRRVPPLVADERHAWIAERLGGGGTDTVEAASFERTPAWFVVGDPPTPLRLTPTELMWKTVFPVVLLVLFALSVVLARRNLRAGRADVRGAVRLSVIMGVFGLLSFNLLAQPHVSWGDVFLTALIMNLFFATFYATSYLALEPIVRRSNPEWLASWTRLLAGRWNDPLVGRDVLIGVAAGVLMCLVSGARGLLEGAVLFGDFQAAAIGGVSAVAVVLRGFNLGVLGSLMWVLLFELIRLVVRRPTVAWAIWFPLALVTWSGFAPNTPAAAVSVAVTLIVWALVLRRSGLLGVSAAVSVYAIFNEEYVTTQLGAWYAGVTVAGLVAVGLLLVWGVVAVRGRSRNAPATGPG